MCVGGGGCSYLETGYINSMRQIAIYLIYNRSIYVYACLYHARDIRLPVYTMYLSLGICRHYNVTGNLPAAARIYASKKIDNPSHNPPAPACDEDQDMTSST